MNSTSDAETRQGTSANPSAEDAERGRLFGWDIHGDGRKIALGVVVALNERLDWPRTIGTGAQHVIIMPGVTLLVSLLTGFPVDTTLLFSDIGMVVFLPITRNRLLPHLGLSFAFIAPLTATQTQGIGVQFGVVLCASIAPMSVDFVAKFAGKRVPDMIAPPVVTGSIVIPIGLNLASVATESSATQPLVVFVTMVSIASAIAVGRGMVSRLGVLIGALVGWTLAAATGNLSPGATETVGNVVWIGMSVFHTPEFHASATLIGLPVIAALIAENVGHVKAVVTMTGRNLDDITGDALIADSLVTTIAGPVDGFGITTYAENIGATAAARVYSTVVYRVAVFTAIALVFIPKFDVLILTIPTGVPGGVTVVLYGLIGLLGVRIWMDERVGFNNPVNLTATATAPIVGIGNPTPDIGSLTLEGIAWGSVDIIIGYPILNWPYNRIGENRSQVSCPG